LRRFWSFFGIGFRRVPQGDPPDIDWWTHRPETFDVEHTDGVFLIDRHGLERTFYPGVADVGGHVASALRKLLSSDGVKNLEHPPNPWTEPQLRSGIEKLLAEPA
jgi:protein SCO1